MKFQLKLALLGLAAIVITTPLLTARSIAASGNPDFSISISPNSLFVQQGHSVFTNVTVTSRNGFNSPVSLFITSGAISGVTEKFSPNPVTPPAGKSVMSLLNVTTAASANSGTSKITITGTSGLVSHSVTLVLNVGCTFLVVEDLTLHKQIVDGGVINANDSMQVSAKVSGCANSNYAGAIVVSVLGNPGTSDPPEKIVQVQPFTIQYPSNSTASGPVFQVVPLTQADGTKTQNTYHASITWNGDQMEEYAWNHQHFHAQ